jgi:hypothetical protein
LAAAALFNPVRRRIQRAAVRADLAGVVNRVLEPAHVSMWTDDRG